MCEWISVKDKLPDDHIYIILCSRNTVSNETFFLVNVDGINYWFSPLDGVYHDILIDDLWQPLPKPPKA